MDANPMEDERLSSWCMSVETRRKIRKIIAENITQRPEKNKVVNLSGLGVRPRRNLAHMRNDNEIQLGSQPRKKVKLSTEFSEVDCEHLSNQTKLPLQTYPEETFNIQGNQILLYPYCAVGVVTLDAAMEATGFIIGARLVVTCGQGWFNPKDKQSHQRIQFIPASQLLGSLRRYKVKKVYNFEDYKMNEDMQQCSPLLLDLVIMELDTVENLDEIYGSFGYDFDWLPQLQTTLHVKQALLIGFNKIEPVALRQLSGDFLVKGQTIWHQMHAGALALGSPILQKKDGRYIVRGVHRGQFGYMGVPSMTGVLVSKSMGKWIEKCFNKFTVQIDLSCISNEENQIATNEIKYFIRYMSIERSWQINFPLEINLSGNSIGAEGCRVLKNARWVNVKKINLRLNQISDEGCSYLKKAFWPILQQIDLRENNIGAEGSKCLTDAKWPSLKRLDLWQNHIGDEGCMFLKDSTWPQLILLDIGRNEVGPEGCLQISQAHWPRMKRISLRQDHIGNKGCRHLAQAFWPELELIFLSENQISDEGCRYLKEAYWPKLQQIDLSTNSITKVGKKQLRRKTCNIIW